MDTAEVTQDMKWYVVHTYSGYENKAKQALEDRIRAHAMDELFGDVLVPSEKVTEVRGGTKRTTTRKFFPGYMFVRMLLNDDTWHLVKNTPRVTGFVGGGHKPNPLTADEVNQILFRQTASEDRPRPKMSFERNDQVKIIDGPFANFTGTVEEVNEDRATLKVMVTIFGRGTPVELEYFQVEKEA